MSFLELQNVTMDIPIYDATRSFRSTIVNKYIGGTIQQSKSKRVSIRALDALNISLKDGDRLGLIGHNGSGKTTLLRILGGVYKPVQGIFRKEGRITSLFNISPGIDMDDTGIDNIFTVGQYLGMTKQELKDNLEDIVQFSELGDYVNLPIRTYSAGMLTRLSFGIATALNPDILLMDEGIGAGDDNFAKKAKKRLEDFYQRINILVIASHSRQLIRDICNKAILLEHGKLIASGSVDEVFDIYESRDLDNDNGSKQ